MSKKEISKFLVQGILTGKLATVKKDGSPHVVPIWFTVDNDNNRKGDIIFTTNSISIKAKNELLKWATKIAERYMAKKNAQAYGKRNSTEDEVVVRIKPIRIIAKRDIAGWD